MPLRLQQPSQGAYTQTPGINSGLRSGDGHAMAPHVLECSSALIEEAGLVQGAGEISHGTLIGDDGPIEIDGNNGLDELGRLGSG